MPRGDRLVDGIRVDRHEEIGPGVVGDGGALLERQEDDRRGG